MEIPKFRVLVIMKARVGIGMHVTCELNVNQVSNCVIASLQLTGQFPPWCVVDWTDRPLPLANPPVQYTHAANRGVGICGFALLIVFDLLQGQG